MQKTMDECKPKIIEIFKEEIEKEFDGIWD
jgi:hypothetical protein